MTAETQIHYVPMGRWLLWLAEGWRLGSARGLPIAQPMPGAHGEYSVMMWRKETSGAKSP